MKHIESIEQEKVVKWCNNQGILCFSIPNDANLSGGAKRRAIQMKNLKKTGLLTGASDLCVVLERKTLFPEMKRKPKILKDGSLSKEVIPVTDEQIEFIERVNETFTAVAKVCYGFEDAKEFILKYL